MLNRPNEGDLLRHEIFQELQRLDEFSKAVNILMANKTFFRNWEELGIVLEDVDPLARYYEQIESGIAPDIPIELRPDDPDFMEAGTLISMNQIVEASIEDFGDKDYFKIESLGPGADGYLEVKLLENPKNAISNINIYVQYVNDDGSKVSVWLDDGFIGTNLLHEAVNLAELTRPDPTYFIEVLGSETYTGPYVLEIKNTQVVDYARIEEYLANLNKIQSNILDFDILDHLSYNSKKSSFTNQFGDLENFSPVSFFERLFKNKYEQNPNPAQLLRGIELLSEYEQLDDNISHRIKFLHDFALENEVLTVGGYNYTTSIAGLAIPNVPIDATAFAETALIYFALVQSSPQMVRLHCLL